MRAVVNKGNSQTKVKSIYDSAAGGVGIVVKVKNY